MVNPPIANPSKENDQILILPRYSGEKKRIGIPKARPKDSETIRKRNVQ
jgi:hypothetical protein